MSADIEGKFTAQELKDAKYQFKQFDQDGNGSISAAELKAIAKQLGLNLGQDVDSFIAEVDDNKNGQIEYREYLSAILKIKEGKPLKFNTIYSKAAKVMTVSGESGAHSYTEEEVDAFADYMNSVLQGDEQIQDRVPVEHKDLFDSVRDGVLLCKLINAAVPDTIDERVINIKKKLNPWETNENVQLAINSASGIGCTTVNIGANDIMEARPHIILGLMWQVIKIGLLQDINLKNHPELVRLLKEGEELVDFLKLPPEQILLRWFNYHLEQAGSNRRVKNFSSDIKDSENYTTLLQQIAPNKECDNSPMQTSDLNERAEKMLQQSDKIGCRKFLTPKEVVKGNPKLNLAFVANLFNNYPALDPINADDYDFAELLDFDSEGSREERAFKFWIQSLGIDVGNLIEDARDGLVLLKVFDKVEPGIVNWKKANEKPKMKFHKIENTNYVIDLANQLKFITVNNSGLDIHDGKKKQILGVIWQLMRHHLFNILKELGGGKEVSEDDVLAWANNQISDDSISSFKDSKLSTGVFLCKLCSSVSARSCNMDLVTPGESDEDKEQNAKYAISVARKIGAVVFLLWEDIVEVKQKMILTFVGSLMAVSKRSKN